MIKVTKQEWKMIAKDYKGRTPLTNLRQVFGGCIAEGGGTDLYTEGIDFIISDKEDSKHGNNVND